LMTGGVELVSRVFDYDDRHTWASEVYQVFEALAYHQHAPSAQCATQVHVSLSSGWEPQHITPVAEAVMAYMHDFKRLALKMGRSVTWAKDNYAKPNVGHAKKPPESMETADIIKHLRSLRDTKPLVNAMCPSNSLKERPQYYFWNFFRLIDKSVSDSHRTIEFRLPPASTTYTDAVGWINFTNLFIRAALNRSGRWQLSSALSLYDFIAGQAYADQIPEDEMEWLRGLLDFIWE
jgi:hypothetical protein